MLWTELQLEVLSEAEVQGDPVDHQPIALAIADELLRKLSYELTFQELILQDQIFTVSDITQNWFPYPTSPVCIRLIEERIRFVSTPDPTNPVYNFLKPANYRQRAYISGCPLYYSIAGSRVYFYPYSDIIVGQQLVYSYYPLITVSANYNDGMTPLPDRIVNIIKPALIQRMLLYKDSKKAQAFAGLSEQRISQSVD